MKPSNKTVVRIAIGVVLWLIFYVVWFSERRFGNGSLQTFCLAITGPTILVDSAEWIVQAVRKRRK